MNWDELNKIFPILATVAGFGLWCGILTTKVDNLTTQEQYIKIRQEQLDIFQKQLIKVRNNEIFENYSVLPIGTIVAYGGDIENLPENWKLCDGDELNREDYKELYNIIGSNFGSRVNEKFYLPDFQGRFLRGVSHETGRDSGVMERYQSNLRGNIKNSVGSLQNDSISLEGISIVENGKHEHNYKDIYWMEIDGKTDPELNINAGNNSGTDSDNKPHQISRKTVSSGSHNHSFSGGGKETRPKNVYVEWIIKVK